MHLDLVNKKHNKKKLDSERSCQVYRNLNQKYQKLRLELNAGLSNERLINFISFYFPYCAIQNLTRRLKEVSKMAVSFRAAKLLRSKGKLRIYRSNVWLRKFISISTCYGLLKNYGRHTFVHWWKFRFWIWLCRTNI